MIASESMTDPTGLRHVVCTPDRDTHDHDYVGVFGPEADKYARFYRDRGDRVDVVRIDITQRPRDKAAAVLAALAGPPVDRLVFMCHGWKTGFQLGLELPQVPAFARSVAAAASDQLKVVLYCCSTGRSDGPPGDGGAGSFADVLRDQLAAAGRTQTSVFSHTTAGHATRNPAVRMFYPENPAGVNLARPGTPEWNKLNTRLHGAKDDLRWRLPFLSLAEAQAEIGA
jgi:hypothetical protein